MCVCERERDRQTNEIFFLQHRITWTDEEGDVVTIETDEELIIALKEMKGPVYKFSIVVLDDEKNREGHTGKKRPNKRLRGIKSKE
jgi:hypothetical protein